MLERVGRLIATLKRIAGGMIPSGLLPPTKVVELASTPKVDTKPLMRWVSVTGDGSEALLWMTRAVTLMKQSSEFHQLVNTMASVSMREGFPFDAPRLTDTSLYCLALGYKRRLTPQQALSDLCYSMKETIVSYRPTHPTVM